MAPLWMFVHNCIIHPAMGIIELFAWGWCPDWLDRAHDWSALKAWPEPRRKRGDA